MRFECTTAAVTAAAFFALIHLTPVNAVAPTDVSISFAGSNNYFLHGAAPEEQERYLSTLASWNVRVVRLWITHTAAPCIKGSAVRNISSLEETDTGVGIYKDDVLDAVDLTLGLLQKYGLKAIISPHDAGVVNGSNGCDAYCLKYSDSDKFYTNATAISEYDARLTHILEYKSKHFDKPWSQLSEVIGAFDLQNEPLIGSAGLLNASIASQDNAAGDWLCGRAKKLKSLIGSSGIKVATGGIGGSEYCCDHEFNTLPAALLCPDIDIISIHGYMTTPEQWAYFLPQRNVDAAEQAGKHLMLEEWGVKASPANQFSEQVAVFNNKSGSAVPWIYWQVVPDCDGSQNCAGTCSNKTAQGYDGYEIGLNSTKADVRTAVMEANSLKAAQDWTGYF